MTNPLHDKARIGGSKILLGVPADNTAGGSSVPCYWSYVSGYPSYDGSSCGQVIALTIPPNVVKDKIHIFSWLIFDTEIVNQFVGYVVIDAAVRWRTALHTGPEKSIYYKRVWSEESWADFSQGMFYADTIEGGNLTATEITNGFTIYLDVMPHAYSLYNFSAQRNVTVKRTFICY